ncbi:MAG: EI24 domain-containing protein [Roseinatronobacter sp.]
MILSSFAFAIGQLRDPRFRHVIWLGIALAIALLFVMYALILLVVQLFVPGTLTVPLAGEVTGLRILLSIGSLLFVIGLSIFLMAPVASAFTSLFLDDVANAVEAEHYPHMTPPAPVGFLTALRETLGYFGLLVGLNLLGMVVFVISGGLGMIVLWAINAWLLSREYFVMVAMRRMDRQTALDLRHKHGFRLWLAGVLMAVPLTIPFVNLLVPVVGAAAFTHLYHRVSARG